MNEVRLRSAGLARDAEDTHVIFTSFYRDYTQVNAQQLRALLKT